MASTANTTLTQRKEWRERIDKYKGKLPWHHTALVWTLADLARANDHMQLLADSAKQNMAQIEMLKNVLSRLVVLQNAATPLPGCKIEWDAAFKDAVYKLELLR